MTEETTVERATDGSTTGRAGGMSDEIAQYGPDGRRWRFSSAVEAARHVGAARNS